jgi:hypothetical protein
MVSKLSEKSSGLFIPDPDPQHWLPLILEHLGTRLGVEKKNVPYRTRLSNIDKLWRAAQLLGQLLHICLRDKPVIPLYPVTLICIHICVQKYTSVYSLPLPNSFLTVIRSFHKVKIISVRAPMVQQFMAVLKKSKCKVSANFYELTAVILKINSETHFMKIGRYSECW